MLSYAPGTAAPVSFDLVDEAGATLLPTALRWRILDEADQELQVWSVVALPEPPAPTITLTIPALLTTLPTGVLRGIRTAELEVAVGGATVYLSASVMLRASTALSVPSNSFQTYNQALLLAGDFASLDGWTAAARELRETALIEARTRLLRLSFRPSKFWDDQSHITDFPSSFHIETLTASQFAALDPRFTRDLARAQLVEANHILSRDAVAEARDNGLLSLTVGESSQFFRSAKPIELQVCSAAYKEVARWVESRIRLGRA